MTPIRKEKVAGLLTLLVALACSSFPSGAHAQAYWQNDYFDVAFDPLAGCIVVSIRYQYDEDAFVDNGDDQSGPTSLAFSMESFGDNEFDPIAEFDIEGQDPETFQLSTDIAGEATGLFHRIQTVKQGNLYTVRLYVTNQGKHIKRLRFHINKWNRKGDDGPLDQHNINVINNVNIPLQGNFSHSVSYREDGQVELTWGSSDNSVSRQSTTTVYNTDGTLLAQSAQGETSGIFILAQEPFTQELYLEQRAYGGQVTERSGTFAVPAFTNPDGLSAVYNSATNQTDITWTIPRATGEEIDLSGFKLQRATKADFSDAVNLDLSPFQRLEYDPDSTTYTYSEAPYANVYYRVARNPRPDWKWGMSQSVHFTAIHAAISEGGHPASGVGVTRNSYNGKNDLWYALLTIYGDATDSDGLEFRIWDASTGKTYLATPSLPVVFQPDAIRGTSRNPLIFSGEEMQFQSIRLNPGWNWVSLNVFNPDLADIGATLANGKWKSGDLVKNPESGFHQYAEKLGWVGTLEGFNNYSLFQLKSSDGQSLSIPGTPVNPANTPISIQGNSWNYISYLPQVSLTVEEALAGYAASQDDVIKSQTGFAMYDSQNGWMGSLTHLEPGKGYMLYRVAPEAVRFHYPALSGSLIHIAGGARGAGPLLKSAVENNYRFSDNMTVVATVDGSFPLQAGDQVLAYVGGALRGKALAAQFPAVSGYRFFLNISGEDQEPVHFEILRAGQVLAVSNTVVTYRSNDLIGSVQNPLVIVTENEAGRITVFPNPFGKQASIRLEFKGKKPHESRTVQLSVYDVDGSKVFEAPQVQTRAGTYITSWDGKNSQGTACRPGVYFIRVSVDRLPLVQKVIKIDSYNQ